MSAIKDQIFTMVELRASKGHNFDQSMELLLELCNAHSGNNLALLSCTRVTLLRSKHHGLLSKRIFKPINIGKGGG